MPNPAPPTASPPDSPRPERPPAWRRICGRLLYLGHLAVRTGWTAGVIALCLLLYLWVVGLPEALKDRALARLDTRPFQIAIDHVMLDPTEGLVARGVYVYRAGDFSEPIARCDTIVLSSNWRRMLREGPGLHTVRVRGGALRLPNWQADAAAARVAFSGIDGTVLVGRDAFRVRSLSARLWGLHVAASGTVVRTHGPQPANPWRELAAFLDGLQQAPARVPDVVNELTAIAYDEPARAELAFAIDPARRDATHVRATVEAGRTRLRGAAFDALRAEADLRGTQLSIPEAVLVAGNRRCHFGGSLSLTSRVVEARLYSDLPPGPWIAVMPAAWQSALRAAGIEASGSMRSEVWTGPVRLEEAAHALGGWISIEQARVRGLWLEKGYCSISVSSNLVAFNNVSMVAGLGAGRGPAEGAMVWNRERRELSGHISLALDPNELLPVLSSNQARIVRRFTFPGPTPRFSGSFLYRADDPDRIEAHGRLAASNCTYRGVALAHLVADVALSNHVLRLDPWHFSRDEGATGGWMAMDLSNHVVQIDLASSMDPLAVAALVGPGLHRALSAWAFRGPVRMRATGEADATDGESRTDLLLDVDGQKMGRTFLLADRATFLLHARGGSYTSTNLAGTVCGGPFTGAVRVFREPGTTNHRFEVTAQFTNASLAQLVAARVKGDRDPGGFVSGEFVVSGIVEQVNGPATRGHGRLRVQNGTLFRLPILGGLSRLLSMIYPGLGFASQTDFACTLAIRDGRVITEDARLEGDVISMKADGHYSFDGSVRFNVEVQLLRRGPLAAVLRFITMPVTKLLEFQLSGTLDDPKWRPVNLPKEMFLIFD